MMNREECVRAFIRMNASDKLRFLTDIAERDERDPRKEFFIACILLPVEDPTAISTFRCDYCGRTRREPELALIGATVSPRHIFRCCRRCYEWDMSIRR